MNQQASHRMRQFGRLWCLVVDGVALYRHLNKARVIQEGARKLCKCRNRPLCGDCRNERQSWRIALEVETIVTGRYCSHHHKGFPKGQTCPNC